MKGLVNSVAVVGLCVFTFVTSQTQIPGPCPNYTVVQNFTVEQYFGNWYAIEKTYAAFSANRTCSTASYSDFGNGTIRVINSAVRANGERGSIEGSARFADPSKKGAKLLVKFPVMGNREGTYWVLDTDYTSYSIVWSCRPAPDGLNSMQIMWYLSRTRKATDYTRGYVRGYLKALEFDATLLEEAVQENCPDSEGNLIV